MKKILMLLCAVLVLSICLTACEIEPGPATNTGDDTSTKAPATTEEPKDTDDPEESTEDPNGSQNNPTGHVHAAPSADALLALTANGTYTCAECGKAGVTIAGAAYDYSVSTKDTEFNTKLPAAVTGTVKSMSFDGTNYYTEGELKLKTAVEGENRVVTLVTESDDVYYYLANVYTDIIATADELLKFTYTLRADISTTGYYALGADIVADPENNILGDSTAAAGYVHTRWSWAKTLKAQAEAGGGFRGVFDGKGYTISGYEFVFGGLFGDVQLGAVIKNLNVTGAKIGESNWRATGILANGLYGCTIENCFFEGTIENKECGMLAFSSGGYVEYTDTEKTVFDENGKVIIKNVTIVSNITTAERAGMTICDPGYAEIYENVTIYQTGIGTAICNDTYVSPIIGETSVAGVTVATPKKLYVDTNYEAVTKGTVDVTAFGTVEGIYTDAALTTNIWSNGQVDISAFTLGESTLVYVKTSNGVEFASLTVVTKVISTHEDLVAFKAKQSAEAKLTGYYVLGADIKAPAGGYTFEGAQLNTWGTWSSADGSTTGFRGTFDGNGHKIDGYTFGVGGLFGDVQRDAVINNVIFDNATVQGNGAAVLGSAIYRASIMNCTFNVTHTETGVDAEGKKAALGYVLGYYMAKCRSNVNITVNVNWAGDTDAILGHKADDSTFTNVVVNQSGDLDVLFAESNSNAAEALKSVTLNMTGAGAQ